MLQYLTKREFDLNWEEAEVLKRCDICEEDFNVLDGYAELKADFVNWEGLGREYLVLCRKCASKIRSHVELLQEATA